MLHSCNLLSVVRTGLDRYRTGHTREQDCRAVKRARANQMTLVCNDATITIRKSTLSQESPLTAVVPKPSEQQNSTKCVQIKRSTDLSDLSLNRMAGWRGKVAEWEQAFMSSHGWRWCHRHRRSVHRLPQLQR